MKWYTYICRCMNESHSSCSPRSTISTVHKWYVYITNEVIGDVYISPHDMYTSSSPHWWCIHIICVLWIHITCVLIGDVYISESRHTYDWVMSHVWIRDAMPKNEWCHVHEWVMRDIEMSGGTHRNEASHTPISHTRISQVIHVNASCHTHHWVMSTWDSAVHWVWPTTVHPLCEDTHAHTHTHTHTCTHTHTQIHTHTHTCTRARMHTHTRIYTHTNG